MIKERNKAKIILLIDKSVLEPTSRFRVEQIGKYLLKDYLVMTGWVPICF